MKKVLLSIAVTCLAVSSVLAGPIAGLVDVATGAAIPDADVRYVLGDGSTNSLGWFTNLYVITSASNGMQVVNWQTMTNYVATAGGVQLDETNIWTALQIFNDNVAIGTNVATHLLQLGATTDGLGIQWADSNDNNLFSVTTNGVGATELIVDSPVAAGDDGAAIMVKRDEGGEKYFKMYIDKGQAAYMKTDATLLVSVINGGVHYVADATDMWKGYGPGAWMLGGGSSKAYSYFNDGDTGIASGGADTNEFWAGGQLVMRHETNGLTHPVVTFFDKDENPDVVISDGDIQLPVGATINGDGGAGSDYIIFPGPGVYLIGGGAEYKVTLSGFSSAQTHSGLLAYSDTIAAPSLASLGDLDCGIAISPSDAPSQDSVYGVTAGLKGWLLNTNGTGEIEFTIFDKDGNEGLNLLDENLIVGGWIKTLGGSGDYISLVDGRGTFSKGAPYLIFEDNTGNAPDLQWKLDAGLFEIEMNDGVGGAYLPRYTINNNGTGDTNTWYGSDGTTKWLEMYTNGTGEIVYNFYDKDGNVPASIVDGTISCGSLSSLDNISADNFKATLSDRQINGNIVGDLQIYNAADGGNVWVFPGAATTHGNLHLGANPGGTWYAETNTLYAGYGVANPAMKIYTNATGEIVFNLYDKDGNVVMSQVDGTLTLNAGLGIGGFSYLSGAGGWNIGNGSGTSQIQMQGTDGLYLQQWNGGGLSQVFSILSYANGSYVGIMTNNPSAPFEVANTNALGVSIIAKGSVSVGVTPTATNIFLNSNGDIDMDGNINLTSDSYIYSAGNNSYIRFRDQGSIYIDVVNVVEYMSSDLTIGDFLSIEQGHATYEFTDTDGRQAAIQMKLEVAQTGTAAFDGLYINPFITSVGDGSTGDGNNIINLSTNSVSKFRVDLEGNVTAVGFVMAKPCAANLYLDAQQEHNLTANYQWMTNMLSTNSTTDCVTLSDSNITVTVAGYYWCAYNIAAHLGAGEEVESAIFVDGVEANNMEDLGSTQASGKVSLNSAGVLYLPLGTEVVDIRVKSLDAAADFDPEKMGFAMHRLN